MNSTSFRSIFNFKGSRASTLVALLVLSSFLMTPTLFALDAIEVGEESGEIAVVDMQQVLTQSIAGKAIKKDLDQIAKEVQSKLAIKKKNLEKERQDLAKQASLLSQSALEEREESVIKKEREFARLVKDKKDEINSKRAAAIARVVREINKVIEQVASEEGIDFVLERDPRIVVHASNELDISEKVLDKLNKRRLEL